MSIRNRRQKDPNFDLDSYLVEKSNEEFESQPEDLPEEKKSSTFFRNTTLIVAAVFASVLWYYDWSPANVYASFFGSPEPTAITLESGAGENILVVPPAETSQEITVIDAGNGESIVVIPPSTTSPVIVNTENIAALEQAAIELANSEEIERLTEESVALALDAAFAALDGLQGIEGLESLESLEGLESLEDLEGFEISINEAIAEAFANVDFSVIEIETGSPNQLSLDQYSRELTSLNINQFDGESVRNLHGSGVPISFLDGLNKVGLLDRLDSDEIIDLFEEN